MFITLSRPALTSSQPLSEKASEVTAPMWFSSGTPLYGEGVHQGWQSGGVDQPEGVDVHASVEVPGAHSLIL